jgi:anti-sigma factor RsiW
MTTPLTPQDWETLSTYLDGQLTATGKRQIQDLIALRPELKQGLEELRRTRAVLRAAPRRRAPRNFTLSPEMAQKVRPRFRWGWTPSFSFASAMATVLLVLSFFFRVNLTQFTPMTALAPVAMTQENTTSGNPPIIIWNAPGSNATGMGGGPAGLGGGDDFGSAEKGIVPSPADSQAAPQQTPGTEPGASPDLPPAIAAAATPAPTNEPRLAAPVAPQPTIEAGITRDGSQSGPILGIAPTEERGKMYVPTQDLYYQADQSTPGNSWQFVQIGLAGVAVIFAAAAFLSWRKAQR